MEALEQVDDAEVLWKACADALREQVSEAVWLTTFNGVEPVSLDGDHLHLGVPSSVVRERIEGRYLPLIRGALADAGAPQVDVVISVRTDEDDFLDTPVEVPSWADRAFDGSGFPQLDEEPYELPDRTPAEVVKVLYAGLDRTLSGLAAAMADVTVVLFDVDLLQHINETEGRMRGDEVLIELAETLSAELVTHPGGSVARVGDDEFVFVHAGTVELNYDGRLVELAAGDCAYFDAATQHKLRQVGDETAEVVVVTSPAPRR